MGGVLQRSLAMLLAIALVVAGMPMAHAMPTEVSAIDGGHHRASPHHAPQHHGDGVVAATHQGHHCDEQATEAASSADHSGQADAATLCKCLNCSLCVAGFFNPISRPTIFERQTIAVVYGFGTTHLAGIAPPIDPGIPILAN